MSTNQLKVIRLIALIITTTFSISIVSGQQIKRSGTYAFIDSISQNTFKLSNLNCRSSDVMLSATAMQRTYIFYSDTLAINVSLFYDQGTIAAGASLQFGVKDGTGYQTVSSRSNVAIDISKLSITQSNVQIVLYDSDGNTYIFSY